MTAAEEETQCHQTFCEEKPCKVPRMPHTVNASNVVFSCTPILDGKWLPSKMLSTLTTAKQPLS